jgi:hypothetical protein
MGILLVCRQGQLPASAESIVGVSIHAANLTTCFPLMPHRCTIAFLALVKYRFLRESRAPRGSLSKICTLSKRKALYLQVDLLSLDKILVKRGTIFLVFFCANQCFCYVALSKENHSRNTANAISLSHWFIRIEI